MITAMDAKVADVFAGFDRIEENRAVLFKTEDDVDPDPHGLLIKAALT